MTLQNFKEKSKNWWDAHENDLFLVAVVALASTIIFGAGRLWFTGFYEVAPRLFDGQTREIIIEENAFPVPPPSAAIKNFMASINGKKYYPAGCKATNSINKENIIWFASEKEAREMGYTPSAQC